MNPLAMLPWLCLPTLAQEPPPVQAAPQEEAGSAAPVEIDASAPAQAAPAVREDEEEGQLPSPDEFTPEPLGDVPPELAQPVLELLEAPSPEELHALEARAMARMGLELALEGRWDDARALFVRLESNYGDTPEGLRAAAHVRDLDIIGLGRAAPWEAIPQPDGSFEIRDQRTGRRVDLDEHPRGERVNAGGRELAITQAFVGAGLLGVGAPLLFDDTSCAVVFLGLGAGVSGGLVTSILVTRQHPITRGQAGAIATGELLGGWNGAVIGAALGGDEPWQVALPTVGGTILGGVAGAAAGIQAKPSAGQVGMVAQGGLWGLGLGGLSFLVVPSDDSRATLIRLGVASDLGALAGAGLASQFNPSRKRMNLIGLSGVAGLAAGTGAQALLREVAVDTPTVTAVSLAVGTLGGLGLGTYVTRDVDGAGEADTASLGHPAPWVGQTQDGAPVVGVALAGGRF